VLTRILAPRCGRLLSCDAAQAAVRQAQDRTSALGNVRAERRALPRDWPPGEFSLIVLSELLYYFDYDPDFIAEVYAPAGADRRAVAQAGGLI
jgi:hypothetical protein